MPEKTKEIIHKELQSTPAITGLPLHIASGPHSLRGLPVCTVICAYIRIRSVWVLGNKLAFTTERVW